MSGFLLDTSVISELVRAKPDARVTQWVDATDENLFFLSVLTLGEIRKGIAALPNAARRVSLEAWLETELRQRFGKRLLPIEEEVADRWGRLAGLARAKGKSLPVIDGLLAATALHHNLTFVSRNAKDVATTGVSTFDPWKT